jgi:hypothetical protein
VRAGRAIAEGSPEQTRRRVMRATSGAFVLGALMGGAVVWWWGREVEAYVQERTRGMRATAAAGLRAVEETAGKLLDRGGQALRRADDFLQDTKEHVSEALRSGQEAIRPAPAPGEGRQPERG